MRGSRCSRRTAFGARFLETSAVLRTPRQSTPCDRALSVRSRSPAPVKHALPDTASGAYVIGCCGRDGPSARLNTMAALLPPNPKELDSTVFTSDSTGLRSGSSSSAGSGVSQPALAGISCFCSASTQTAASTAPAAASECPNAPFTDESSGLRSPNKACIAFASERSLCMVPVPCRLI